MKRKVKITKLPEFSKGGMHLGDQQNYGLYRGGGYLQDYVTGTEVPSDKDIRSVYPEVDREDATIEVEKGEKIVLPDLSGLYNVGGKPHSKGGTPVYAKGGEYVFSNYITMPQVLQDAFGFKGTSSKKKDNTIAKLIGNKIDSKDYNRLSQVLQDANDGKAVDPFELKSAQIRFPEYMETLQKGMVAGELSKALQGKEFKIPENAMPALQKMQESANKEKITEQPLVEAKEGGYMNKQLRITGMGLEKYQQKPGSVPKKITRAEISDYLKLGYKQDPSNPNRLYKEGTDSTTGYRDKYVTITTPGTEATKAPGPGSPAFNQAFAQARQSGAKTFTFNGKSYTTDVYKPGIQSTTEKVKQTEEYDIPGTPGDYVYLEDEKPSFNPYVPGTSTTPQYTKPGITGKPWWTEDVMRTALAFSQNPKAYYPTLQQINLPQTDPVVVEPYYAPITGQAASARNVAAATSSPQQLRAFLSATQPIDAVNNITYQTAVANAERVQRAREQNAQIAGQEALMNANLRGKYISDVDRVRGEFDKEKEMYNANKLAALMQGMGNARKTQVWNDSYGRALGFNINPNYFAPGIEFFGGRNIFSQGQQTTPDLANIDAQYNNLLSKYPKDLTMVHKLMDYMYPQMKGRTSVRSDYGDYNTTYSQPGMIPGYYDAAIPRF